ncbi:MAG: Maf family protein [Methylobacteriaceae bacterium]|nr:Maf family protein [Methylobacteriaceae bacterium]MBV9704069.1 Maf family protein [Methylobacteriaceae bacterium]
MQRPRQTSAHRPAPLWLAPAPLVLASRSAARQSLLAGAGIAFESVPADVDELAIATGLDAAGAMPADIALALADEKARLVSHSYGRRLVLAADQILSLDGTIYSKPRDRAAAQSHLADLSGRTHTLHSAFAVLRDGEHLCAAVAEAHMTMRDLSPAFIARYLDAAGEAALASVGAYQYEGLGIHLFATVEGDRSTIMGLPLLPLIEFLRAEGSVAA